jgi:hypothetical protein
VQDVIVITGPAYLPTLTETSGSGGPGARKSYALNIKIIGTFPHLVHVPSHFYKVILTRRCLSEKHQIISCAAFLVPNKSDDDINVDGEEAYELSPLLRLYVHVSEMVQRAGVYFKAIISPRGGRDEPRQSPKRSTSSTSEKSVLPLTCFALRIDDLVSDVM